MCDIKWFKEAKYGMFIHWGAYSVAGRGEWVLNREHIPYEEYIDKYVNNFKAEKYNPSLWMKLAKTAGMKYVVFTTKHHDGFALWDTKTTEFNSVFMGPKRDLVRPLVNAAREEGLKIGFYFSLCDWHHPDYPNAYCRDWPSSWKDECSRKRFVQFYMSQLEELMTNYGSVDILWYDGGAPQPLESKEAYKMVKSLQPNILINDRNGEPFDFETCEQKIKIKNESAHWELCMTLNDSWGYNPSDSNYKRPKDVISIMTKVAAKKGNLLLNVSPKPDGTLSKQTYEILSEVGTWLQKNGESFYNSSKSPFSWTNTCRLTTKGNNVYVHIFLSPGDELCIAEIENKVIAAEFLSNGKSVDFVKKGTRLFLKNLPVPLPDPVCTVIKLTLDGEPIAYKKC